MQRNQISANFLTDNPALYEQRFPDPDNDAGRFVADLVERFDGGREILDVGCGTGRDARYWVDRGHDVVGVDTSANMVDYARTHCPGGEFVVADMREFALPRTFGTIVCLDSALLYCHSNAELDAFLTRAYEHLSPGGLLVAEMRSGAFFLGNTELLDGVRENTVHHDGHDYHSRTWLWIDHARQLLSRERVWTWSAEQESVRERSAWRLIFPQELCYVLRSNGFDVVELFDSPGPRADRPWSAGTPVSTELSGDRLHVVARRC